MAKHTKLKERMIFILLRCVGRSTPFLEMNRNQRPDYEEQPDYEDWLWSLDDDTFIDSFAEVLYEEYESARHASKEAKTGIRIRTRTIANYGSPNAMGSHMTLAISTGYKVGRNDPNSRR